ncbi:helix-turn-helix domain-containing protein [Actinomadura madurae]|uniref:helix-turn-helix domain-containing protein n=1 Tax=Actinomadura madurae TaxID=1993 RepID=UPI0020261B2C|nr:helix-turn-helix domain-containing protein [Actinomadura madurae]URM97378.1 helix-turn-helix domain-containing protein [Actinomadura madurae]
MAWLLDHHHDAHAGVQQMVAAAQVSLRQLQTLCDSHLGVTPTQLIRQVRLHRARTALLHARPGQVAVASIAAQVGYLSPSRFAAHYRTRYGETPSTTLRRAAPIPRPDGPLPHPAWAISQKEEHIR